MAAAIHGGHQPECFSHWAVVVLWVDLLNNALLRKHPSKQGNHVSPSADTVSYTQLPKRKETETTHNFIFIETKDGVYKAFRSPH